MLRRTALVAFIVWASVQAPQLHAQIPVQDLLATIGPWECVDSNGVHGIFITGRSYPDSLDFPSVSIQIYQRGTQNQAGYFDPGPTNRVTVFDGKRLSIQFKGLNNVDSRHMPAFDMDLAFDPAAKRWAGTWSLCDKPGGAVLERPQPSPGVAPHAFVGRWEGSIAGMPLLRSGTLQIYQSIDGKTVASLHLVVSSGQQHVYEASVEFPTARSFVLRTVGHRYDGTLSDDGKILDGKWINDGATGVMSIGGQGPTLLAPILYRRAE